MAADQTKFDATVIPARGSQGDPEPTDLILFGGRSTTLRTGYSLQTAEPEVAVKGDRILMTWNRMAARSLNGGQTFEWLQPWTSFPKADEGFCCDQRAIYVPRQDLWLWVLQYHSGPGESNTIRLGWAAGDEAFDAGRFQYTDWKPPDVGLQDGLFFDQPKLAVSDDHFFLSINAFRAGTFQKAVVIRGALEDLVNGRTPRASCLVPIAPTSGQPIFGPYPVRTAGDTMYLAAHVSTSELAVWSWPDSQQSAAYHSVIQYDDSGKAIHYPRQDPYSCPRTGAGPKSDWCFRPEAKENPTDPDKSANDERITSGWTGQGSIGFAWNASQGDGFAYPFVWVMILDPTRLEACAAGECVLGTPHIMSESLAFQYASIAANPDGSLGGLVIFGGGEYYIGCATVARDVSAVATTAWDLASVASSTTDMPSPNSGDYLGVTSDGQSANGWAGACMTYDPSLTADGGGTLIHFVRFGRRADAP